MPLGPQDLLQRACEDAGPLTLHVLVQQLDAGTGLLADVAEHEPLLAHDDARCLCADQQHRLHLARRLLALGPEGLREPGVHKLLENGALAVGPDHNDKVVAYALTGSHAHLAAHDGGQLLHLHAALSDDSTREPARHGHVDLHDIRRRAGVIDHLCWTPRGRRLRQGHGHHRGHGCCRLPSARAPTLHAVDVGQPFPDARAVDVPRWLAAHLLRRGRLFLERSVDGLLLGLICAKLRGCLPRR
mmetsp:Transcript_79198/g.235973  ORF Transcript_79198/g.235973 Transcript_79198/m.235973 type:complete len:244 (+) Transcript_79198:213-944(+)